MAFEISLCSSIQHWFENNDFAGLSPVPAFCLPGPYRQGWLGSIGIQFFGDETECNLFVPFQAFLEQTGQVQSDLDMRGGFFSILHPRYATQLILVHEPQ